MNFGQSDPFVGEWLRGEGLESDLVISSRVRLARNLTDLPLGTVAGDLQRAKVADRGQDREGIRDSLSCKGHLQSGGTRASFAGPVGGLP